MSDRELRIVSLLPSATEIVAALGLADHLVGRSHQCDYPAGVETLPALSSTRIEPVGTSQEIDARVRAVLADGVSMYQVDDDRLQALRPDFILTQTQCAICAVTPDDLVDALDAWPVGKPTTLSLEPNDLGDVWRGIQQVGDTLGVGDTAREVVASLVARIDALRAETAGFPPSTVVAIEWMSPLMAGGNWMPELIEAAGGVSLLAAPGEHSPVIEWEALAAADPEVILLLSCGFRIDQSVADIDVMARHPLWQGLRAVKSGQVFVIDGHHYFNRPGPRLVESAEIVAEILHPAHIDFGHHGTGWVRLDETAGARALPASVRTR